MSLKNQSSYRLAFDLGSTSLGWAILKIKPDTEHPNRKQPYAIVKAGVRIFSDGRNPKDGSSLAVTRRDARGMRRRRDRLLKRKARMMHLLVEHGFFPQDITERKKLENLNPYELRAKGLNSALAPGEFARALFHLNQRRGFKSNRKTDKADNEAGAMKTAMSATWREIQDKNCRTIGELLWKRYQETHIQGEKPRPSVRARYRETRITTDEGKNKIEKSYDLYIDRAMVETEFETLWQKQAELNPTLFNDTAKATLKDCLLHQRQLRPVDPGRCTLLPHEKRAPLALPSTQRFRIYQEVNNLRILDDQLQQHQLTLAQRDAIVAKLEETSKQTFKQLAKLLKLPSATQFNLEDAKRTELKGNATSAVLKKDYYFGKAWFDFDKALQDDIVMHIVNEQSEVELVQWLMQHTGVDEPHAQAIANARLPDSYGSLSTKALARILPELRKSVITYDKAVLAAGFDHHSHISHSATGEILPELPYYGQYLQRHVGFGTGKQEDRPEKRFGRIANPTVHIGLNQVRTVVNAIIKRYGHPAEVVIEVARDLKQSREQKLDQQREQATNQKRNDTYRAEIAKVLRISETQVSHADIQKMILWTELNPHDAADRRCPYTGEQISLRRLFSPEVEIEHILPFSRTLDDSLNNKTVSLVRANRIKGNRTPWEAKADFEAQGWDFEGMVHRVMFMDRRKRYRFGEDGYQLWLRDDKDFIARALNDTRYLSRVAREYLSLICPQATRVIPGQMTALLRAKFGLNDILGLKGEKNRNDHRHHAVDACVIGVTDQGMLQRFAQANASAVENRLQKLVDTMPLPWPTYREHVQRAIDNIKVSHKPDHGYEGGMHNDTAYGLLGNGIVHVHKMVEGKRQDEVEKLSVIEMSEPQAMALRDNVLAPRHGVLSNGAPRSYKGYKGDSNYCMEITRDEHGRWQGRVVSTFEAYQFVRKHGENNKTLLRDPRTGINGQPLVMRVMRNDCVKLEVDGTMQIMRLTSIRSSGKLSFAPIHEANADARNRSKDDPFSYVTKTAGSLFKAKGRLVTISPIGEVRDPGFKP